EAGRVRGAARRGGGLARGLLRGRGVVDGAGKGREPAAGDPLAAEVRAAVRLDEAGIAAALRAATGWERAGAGVRPPYRFRCFREALAFVNRVGGLAEAAGHHPAIDIRYNTV